MEKPSKITYYDESGIETENSKNRKPSKGAVFIVVFLVFAFIMGAVGGFGSLVFLSSNLLKTLIICSFCSDPKFNTFCIQ